MVLVPENYEISLQYTNMRGRYNFVIDNAFANAITIAFEIISDNEHDAQII